MSYKSLEELEEKSIGVLGETGRTGSMVCDLILRQYQSPWNKTNHFFRLGPSFSSKSVYNLYDVVSTNDLLIDFSAGTLTQSIVDTLLITPKPLVFCVSNPPFDVMAEDSPLRKLGKKTAVLLAPNTSFLSYIQQKFSQFLSFMVSQNYDIDITDVHHHLKKDAPSGTSKALANAIVHGAKLNGVDLTSGSLPPEGKDFSRHGHVCLFSPRQGKSPVCHNVSFTNQWERFEIVQEVWSYELFAKGAIDLAYWLRDQKPGLYTLDDVYGKYLEEGIGKIFGKNVVF